MEQTRTRPEKKAIKGAGTTTCLTSPAQDISMAILSCRDTANGYDCFVYLGLALSRGIVL